MYRYITIVMLLMPTMCGPDIEVRDQRQVDSGPTTELERKVSYLAEIVGSLATVSDFSTCNSDNLSALEVKVCKIAQAATAEQQVVLASRLAELARVLQSSLYGEDCIPSEVDTFPVGCPLPSSIMYRMDMAEDDLVLLDAQVTGLLASVAGLDSRLTSAEDAISALDNRVSVLEAQLDTSETLSIVELCTDTAPTTGPVFEAVLFTGDRAKLIAFVQSGSKRGMSVLVEETDPPLYTQTNLNTKTCRIKIYTHGSGQGMDVCWRNNNRSASEAQIDAVCLPTPSLNCTCQ